VYSQSLAPKQGRVRVAFSNAMAKELYEKFEQLQKDTRIPKSKLFDEAIEHLLKKYGRI
jgi:predicted DNA-binding protein